jgi:hypothetical protein
MATRELTEIVGWDETVRVYSDSIEIVEELAAPHKLITLLEGIDPDTQTKRRWLEVNNERSTNDDPRNMAYDHEDVTDEDQFIAHLEDAGWAFEKAHAAYRGA